MTERLKIVSKFIVLFSFLTNNRVQNCKGKALPSFLYIQNSLEFCQILLRERFHEIFQSKFQRYFSFWSVAAVLK